MSIPYTQTFVARWADMDFNAHMKNTAYLDYAGDVRMLYFADNGFSMQEFMRQQFGPVVFQDEIRYFKELQLLERFSVTLTLTELSDDAARFKLCNAFYKTDGTPIATITSSGAWLSLKTRKLTVPPEALVTVLKRLKSEWGSCHLS